MGAIGVFDGIWHCWRGSDDHGTVLLLQPLMKYLHVQQTQEPGSHSTHDVAGHLMATLVIWYMNAFLIRAPASKPSAQCSTVLPADCHAGIIQDQTVHGR